MKKKKQRLIGQAALDEAFAALEVKQLREQLGVEISDGLLALALTHVSFSNEREVPSNERLEFLGDAVLGLFVAEELYRLHPDVNEQVLTKMRANLVNTYSLAEKGRQMDLGRFVILGKGEQVSGGNDTNSILEDTVEALLGAIYLEFGMEVAKATVLRWFADEIVNANADNLRMDWKTELSKLLDGVRMNDLEFEVSKSGPDHAPHFKAQLLLPNGSVFFGEGSNKRSAEHQAAQHATMALRDKQRAARGAQPAETQAPLGEDGEPPSTTDE